MTLSKTHATQFQNYILRWYHRYGRHELPWRQTTNPYHIMISEIMLQQTQVDRVIPKFLAFIEQYPHPSDLVTAPQSEALKLWQGLGYNRRLLNLKKAAQVIVDQELMSHFPTETAELIKLPGVGPYTASAVRSFAFDLPTVVIETNIRTVFIHHFFPGQTKVPDNLLEPLIEQTIGPSPREWYSALMDYGTHLKKVLPNPSRRSKHHQTQSKFTGSKRQVRGNVLKKLAVKPARLLELESIEGNLQYLPEVLDTLLKEGFIVQDRDQTYHLAD